jgi:hypothetical protein
LIHVIERPVAEQQVAEMLEALGSYIKLAVDVERAILAGGGELHADCEVVLLERGSEQADIWGADWIPQTQEVRFEALINIRPRQSNPSMTILDGGLRHRVETVVKSLLAR